MFRIWDNVITWRVDAKAESITFIGEPNEGLSVPERVRSDVVQSFCNTLVLVNE